MRSPQLLRNGETPTPTPTPFNNFSTLSLQKLRRFNFLVLLRAAAFCFSLSAALFMATNWRPDSAKWIHFNAFRFVVAANGIVAVYSLLETGASVWRILKGRTPLPEPVLDALPVLQPLPITIFWLSIQYFIFGIADLFTYVGLLEFLYSEAPKGLKSISTCFLWCSMWLGYFFSGILVQVVNRVTKGSSKSKGWLRGNNINRNNLNLFYWLLSVLSLINFVNYLYWARWYKYRPQQPVEVVIVSVAKKEIQG